MPGEEEEQEIENLFEQIMKENFPKIANEKQYGPNERTDKNPKNRTKG